MTYPGSEEEVEVFVEEDLVGVVAETEALQELVGQLHHLVHPRVSVLEGKEVRMKTFDYGSNSLFSLMTF